MSQEESNKSKGLQSLCDLGWEIEKGEFDLDTFIDVVTYDPVGVIQTAIRSVTETLQILTRNTYPWWVNLIEAATPLNLQIDGSDRAALAGSMLKKKYQPNLTIYRHNLRAIDSDLTQQSSTVTVASVHNLLSLTIVRRILQNLGTPDFIQTYHNRCVYTYPTKLFQSWNTFTKIPTDVYACWHKQDVWLQIHSHSNTQDEQVSTIQDYTLYGDNLQSLIDYAAAGIGVRVAGVNINIGQVASEYLLDSFPPDIQQLSERVKDKATSCHKFAVLVHGKPGTGKSVWAQAIVKELLVPEGYVTFILDHSAIEQFVPPRYLNKICLIINEADNLALDRKQTDINSGKTERILSLLDGTVYKSITVDGNTNNQKLIVLLTCNTTDRLDPAFLRPGRIDCLHEFTHKFV